MEATKRCSRCREHLPLSLFGVCNRMPDKLNYYCKPCQNGINERFRKSPAGRAYNRAYHKAYAATEHGRRKCLDKINRWKERNRDKERAHKSIKTGLGSGTIPYASSLLCARCGLQAREYHHYAGYAWENRRVVVALCKQCHMAYDKIQKCAA